MNARSGLGMRGLYQLKVGTTPAFTICSSCVSKVAPVTRYRFVDGLGEVLDEGSFDDHATALAWARDEEETGDVQRVEYLGPEGDWRWAGPLEG